MPYVVDSDFRYGKLDKNCEAVWFSSMITMTLLPVVLTATGVTELDAAEAALVPMAFVAVTVNVYAVPLVKPPTTTEVAEATAVVTDPFEPVTV